MTENAIFAEASSIADARERTAFLDWACADDSALRRRVEERLAVHMETGTFLSPPPPAATPEQTLPVTEKPDTGIHDPERTGTFQGVGPRVASGTSGLIAGRYRILQPLGEGGMGSVYLAEQLHPVRRQVALKLIKQGIDTARVIARFDAERQALAVMDHPNIARVYDAGVIPPASVGAAPEPFFVMELVLGEPLTEFCDEKCLSVVERINLFIQICNAVQHAHQKGVVHRDLKPSNILVTEVDGKPVPKVIDFGLAKALQAGVLPDVSLDARGSVLGTPLYMAPEQADPTTTDIDTRADVYALGGILYELLTGSTPIERSTIRKAGLAEVLRVIREAEPPTPTRRLQSSATLKGVARSRQLEPGKLVKLVRGDLEWVTLKALAKDRDQRFPSAAALAEDLQRFLRNEPVSAGPPSAWYRARKFVKRNRGPVVAASLLFVALLAGIAGTTWGLLRALAAESTAKNTLAELTEAQKKTATALAQVTTEQGNTTAALSRERETSGKLATALGAEASARAETRAALHTVISDVVEESLARRSVLTIKEKEFLRKLLAMADRMAQDQGDSAEARYTRALSYLHVGKVRQRLGELIEAEAALREAVVVFRELAELSAAPAKHRQGLALAHQRLGMVLKDRGQHAEAQAEWLASLAISEQLVADHPKDVVYRGALAYTRNNLGVHCLDTGDAKGARKWFQEALSDFETLSTLSTDPDYPLAVVGIHDNLGVVAIGQGQYAEAVKHFQVAIEKLLPMVAADPLVPEYRLHLGQAYTHSASARLSGRIPGAQPDYVHAVNVLERLCSEFPLVPAYSSALGDARDGLGQLYLRTGRPDDAAPHFQRAITLRAILADGFRDNPSYAHALAGSHNNLGLAAKAAERWKDAADHFERARGIWEELSRRYKTVSRYAIQLGACYVNLGNLQREQGQSAEAFRWYDRAIGQFEAVLKTDPRNAETRQFLRNANSAYAKSLELLGRYADALERWDLAIELTAVAERPLLILEHARCWVLAGKVAEGVGEAQLVVRQISAPLILVDAAGVLAVAARVDKDAERCERYAVQAVAMLRQAKGAKWFADPNEVEHLKSHPDFAVLRTRLDFRQLLAEIEGKPLPANLAPVPREVVK